MTQKHLFEMAGNRLLKRQGWDAPSLRELLPGQRTPCPCSQNITCTGLETPVRGQKSVLWVRKEGNNQGVSCTTAQALMRIVSNAFLSTVSLAA